MSDLLPEATLDYFMKLQPGTLPDLLGLEVLEVGEGLLKGRMKVERRHHAPNGFLHAASIIALADTCAGYATFAHLPKGARGFTTIELKSNFFGTALDGYIHCTATSRHRGRTTQVWDAEVSNDAGKLIAAFRCTQMILS
ncbi:PaaI family thioesterase [Nevskia ramosa]|uniref:PaaI family thioesterase n=1 Tax=Nevskia ramosa TaxID=64002 RepID=UPI0003B30083|nr:PaaI family thioesterase [Nevskia ramosa]